MSSTVDKARTQRVERLKSTLETRLEQPPAALEALVSELQAGDQRLDLWEQLHAAACRDTKEPELAAAYRTVLTARRRQQLPPAGQVEVLMHGADYFQGVLGDVDGAEAFLQRVLEVVPGHPAAFARLESRFEATRDNRRMAELYASVAATPPKPAQQLARGALDALSVLGPAAPISDDACRRLLVLAPANRGIVDALEAHCKKTGRPALAASLLEQAILEPDLPEQSVVELRRRILDLYGEARAPEKAIEHIEALLALLPGDARARGAAERLLSNRDVASRAAAVLQQARRIVRATDAPPR